jgi:hypothetical protein
MRTYNNQVNHKSEYIHYYLFLRPQAIINHIHRISFHIYGRIVTLHLQATSQNIMKPKASNFTQGILHQHFHFTSEKEIFFIYISASNIKEQISIFTIYKKSKAKHKIIHYQYVLQGKPQIFHPTH